LTSSTYDNVVCKPGPNLNVIIGPNGTGKSSIICGICLAVGGKPKILGRSDSIADFVKHGQQQGSAEVHMYAVYHYFTRFILCQNFLLLFLIDTNALKIEMLSLPLFRSWDTALSRSVVFGLRIDALKNMAHHSIDGKAIKVTELREEAKKFNIQVTYLRTQKYQKLFSFTYRWITLALSLHRTK